MLFPFGSTKSTSVIGRHIQAVVEGVGIASLLGSQGFLLRMSRNPSIVESIHRKALDEECDDMRLPLVLHCFERPWMAIVVARMVTVGL